MKQNLSYAAFAAMLLSALTIGVAHAGSDDLKWIGKCVSDNADQKQSEATVMTYCSCMNNLMSDNETQSITQWEKSHKTEEEMCGKKAGWVGK